MLPAQLAFSRLATRRISLLTLAGGVLLASGCGTFRESDCQPRTGWLSHFHLTSRTKPMPAMTSSPCPCEGSVPMTSDGTVIVPPNAGLPPGFTLPPGAVVPPNGFVPPPPSIINMPPTGAQPPRIEPQAIPKQYTP